MLDIVRHNQRNRRNMKKKPDSYIGARITKEEKSLFELKAQKQHRSTSDMLRLLVRRFITKGSK